MPVPPKKGMKLTRPERQGSAQGVGKLSLAVALVLAGFTACASHGNGLALETPGTPSRTGCDADVETDSLNGVHLRLVNTSVSRSCRATRLTLEFTSGVERDWIQASTPSGWQQLYVGCTSGGRVCGVAWYGGAGVGAGESQGGFVVMCDPRRLKSWTVDLGGKRRVGVPYGWVGGSVGPPPEKIIEPSNKGVNVTKGEPGWSEAQP
jgi:hypothetical protein